MGEVKYDTSESEVQSGSRIVQSGLTINELLEKEVTIFGESEKR